MSCAQQSGTMSSIVTFTMEPNNYLERCENSRLAFIGLMSTFYRFNVIKKMPDVYMNDIIRLTTLHDRNKKALLRAP
jgi:hypothetical protein